MAQNKRVGLKSALRGTHANYFDNLIDSVSTLQDGGVMAAGSVFGFRIGKNLGVFSEVTLQRYWDRNLKEIKVGLNYKL